jgi:hypothetical protein
MATLRITAASAAALGAAALALSACKPHDGEANGAWVSGQHEASVAPTRHAAAKLARHRHVPPRGSYQAIARVPPPPLPMYAQPPPPAPGWIWAPGWWAWSDEARDYFWVPGAWVQPPAPGLYWTPGYWRYWDGMYLWSPGYWGPGVGFYGGVGYGYGYDGRGYSGGRWEEGQFWYNRQANNLRGMNAPTVYDQPPGAGRRDRTSYNGGPGGLRAEPTLAEAAASRGPHAPPTRAQAEEEQFASAQPQQRAGANHGSPPLAALRLPNLFHMAGSMVGAIRSARIYPPPQPDLPPARRSGHHARTQPEARGYTTGEPYP